MTEIPYERLDALESAFGGRAAVQAAFEAGRASLGIRHIVFPFTFDTPGLTDGVPFHTPRVGDLLLSAWVEVGVAWNGTTPLGDIGGFNGNVGLMALNAGPLVMSVAWTDSGGVSSIQESVPGAYSGSFAYYLAGSRVTDASPLLVVVSQDGSKGGANPGATRGSAELHLLLL